MRKKLKWNISLIIIIALLVAGAVYISDYYRADEVATEAIVNPPAGITVTETEDGLVFAPEEPVAGLIFYPGAKVEYSSYAPLMEKLAGEGVLCVLTKLTGNIAFLEMNAADGIEAKYPEVGDWYIGGHSLGGVGAAYYASKHADEFKGLVLLASYSISDLTDSGLKVLLVKGSNDGVLKADPYEENKENLPEDVTELTIEGGCHAFFGDYGLQEGDGEATIDAATQQAETVEAIVDFMDITVEKTYDDRFKLIGYLPDWYDESVIDEVQLEKFTHINYAFAIPDKDGNILEFDNPSFAEKLIERAHESGVKVLLSVGGWSYNDVTLQGTFDEATRTEEGAQKLADSIIAVVKEYGFDGVDVDWEYPTSATIKQYDNLISDLYDYLYKKNLLLTAAVATGDGFSDETLEKFDWINVMAYDGDAGAGHSPISLAVYDLDYWISSRNVDKTRVNLGVPFYARPNWETYEYIVTLDPANAHLDKTKINGTVSYYNGIETMKIKTAYALEHAGGVMVWEITQDSSDPELSLLNAICETIASASE